MLMPSETLTIALISDVFHDNQPLERLKQRLHEAREAGAELAVLPELPLNPWSPATTSFIASDAEAPVGERAKMQREAAAEIGIAVVGGAIITDPATKRRHNTALVIDSRGELRGTFRKCHIPEEPGFWETSHYDAGDAIGPVFDFLGVPFGVQICSDINRPEGSHLLAAMGAELIIAPRATEQATWQRWRTVFQASAMTSCAYIASVNRPAPEQGVLIGGPSIIVAPDGRILIETTDPLAMATLERAAVAQARKAYPGYLPVRADLYADAWGKVAAGCARVKSAYDTATGSAVRCG